MLKIHNIAKNTSYLTIALILQKIISFSYFAILARYLGPYSLGQYYFALSFTTIFAIIIDLGLANVLTREVAKDKDKTGAYFGNILALKIPLSLLAIALAVLVINLLDTDPVVRGLVYISCVSMVLDSFTTIFFALSRGLHNLKYESLASVMFQLIVLSAGWLALYLKLDLIYVMSALALASLYNFIYAWIVLRRRLKVKIKLDFNKTLIREIILVAWPFAAFAILQRLYTYLDSVLLTLLAGSVETGIYQVAFKIIFALQFLPLAFTASLYPALSYYWLNNKEQLRITFERALNYLIIVSLPIIAGIVVLADRIVLIFKADFLAATFPLQISIVALFFIFLNFPIGSLLNACDRQGKNTLNMAIVTVCSVALNLLLIPHFKVVGASVTVLVTNILMFILGVYQLRKIIDYRPRKNLIVFFKSLLAALIMATLIFLGQSAFSLLLAVVIGGVIYFLFLFLLGGFSRADISSIRQSFRL